MPIILFFPVLQILGLVLFLVPWMYYMAFVHSQGTFICENSCSGQVSRRARTLLVWPVHFHTVVRFAASPTNATLRTRATA